MRDIKGKFPAYFTCFNLPEGAKEEAIEVYRACRTNKVDRESFLPTFEENDFKCTEEEASDPSTYSLSTYEKPKDVKRFAVTNCEYRPPFKIARGKTEPVYGMVQRTKERKPKYKSSHVDWWIYENAEPQMSFELIEDFKKYLSEYQSKKEGSK